MSQVMSWTNRERKFPGHFHSGQGVPGSESFREQIGQGPIFCFSPESELARQ